MKKRLSVFLLVLLVSLSAGVVFAFWDNLSVEKTNSIEIGEGITLEVLANATAQAGKVLVPSTVVLKTTDVDSIVLTYNVKLDKIAQTPLKLEVEVSDIKIGSSVDTVINDLANVDVTQDYSTVNNTDVVITVTVTLTEPADEAAYEVVAGEAITFKLTFTATIA